MQTVTSLTEQLRVLRKGGPVKAGRSRKGLNKPTLVLVSVRTVSRLKAAFTPNVINKFCVYHVDNITEVTCQQKNTNLR